MQENFYTRTDSLVLPNHSLLATPSEQSSAITYTCWFPFQHEDRPVEASIVTARVNTPSGIFRTTFLAIAKDTSRKDLDFTMLSDADYFDTHGGLKICASQIFPDYFVDTSTACVRHQIYDNIMKSILNKD